jgi:hypothetical protein
MENKINIPADAFQDVKCPACGGLYFYQISRVKYYKGVLAPAPVQAVLPVLRCIGCLHVLGEPLKNEPHGGVALS